MQTITKTELAWIYSALEHEVMRSVEAMNDSDYGSLEYQLAEHNKEKIAWNNEQNSCNIE